MSIMQITSSQPSLYVRKTSQFLQRSSKPCSLPVHARLPLRNPSLATRNASNQQHCMLTLKSQKCRAASMYQYPSPVCLLDEKGKNGSDEGGLVPMIEEELRNKDKGSAWKAPENTTGDLKKESSIEDVLRNQIEKKEFYKDSAIRGGGGSRGGGGGAGGNGGGGAGGSSGSEGGGFAGIINETLQVILATISVAFLYVCIISGEEWIRLAKDYMKFLFSGSESARLKVAMDKWGRFYQKLTKKKLYDKVEKGHYQQPEEGHNQQPDLVG